MTHRSAPLAGELALSRLRKELERLFQEVTVAGESLHRPGTWNPPVDVLERSDELLVLVEVPGLGPEDLAVEIEGSTLIVRGSRSLGYGNGLRFHCVERMKGSFTRRIQIFHTVNSHEATVELAGGILRIHLPKVRERRRKTLRLSIEEHEEKS